MADDNCPHGFTYDACDYDSCREIDALRAEVARQIKENESLAEANLTYAMETKELRDEVERLKVAEGEAMLVVESQDVSIAALRAEVAALKADLADLNSETVSRTFHNNLMQDFCARAETAEAKAAELQAELERKHNQIEYYERTRFCHSRYAKRMILYTDTVNGEPCGMDNLWAVCTDELNEYEQAIAALQARIAKFEGPLTDEQREFVSKRMRVANNRNMTQWDAAIRAAREGAR